VLRVSLFNGNQSYEGGATQGTHQEGSLAAASSERRHTTVVGFSWASTLVGARSDGPSVVKLCQMGAVEFPGSLCGLGWGRAATK
jgi:hypothetical protein